MGNIYWLASYPKSGNTWMRILLTNYIINADTPIDINKLMSMPIASSRLWFDEWVGIEASVLDDELIEKLRPEVYRCLARSEAGNIFLKVHDAWKYTGLGEGLFPEDVTDGVVYILRNPLDLVASCANHWGVTLDQSAENICDDKFCLSKSSRGTLDQLEQFLGTWSYHVKSWLYDSGLRVLLVKYEDLLNNTEFHFGRIVKFCNLPWDEERVLKSVKFSRFSELQRQEKNMNFRERPQNAIGQFFRKGKGGGWKEELPEYLIDKIVSKHGEIMREFGYLNNNNQPV